MHWAKRDYHRKAVGCSDDGVLAYRHLLAGTGISSWSCVSPARGPASVDRLLDIMPIHIGKRPTDPNLQVEWPARGTTSHELGDVVSVPPIRAASRKGRRPGR
jgi:hypothetical protein